MIMRFHWESRHFRDWYTLQYRKLLQCIHSTSAFIAVLIGQSESKSDYWLDSNHVTMFSHLSRIESELQSGPMLVAKFLPWFREGRELTFPANLEGPLEANLMQKFIGPVIDQWTQWGSTRKSLRSRDRCHLGSVATSYETGHDILARYSLMKISFYILNVDYSLVHMCIEDLTITF